MVNNLIEVLSKEEEALKGLLSMLDDQHKKITTKDIFGLEEVVEKIQQANREIAVIEVERRKFVGNNSMKSVVMNSGNVELEDGYRRVSNILNEINLQKDTNELLIKQGLSYTNKMLNLINPKKETNVYNSYGAIKR